MERDFRFPYKFKLSQREQIRCQELIDHFYNKYDLIFLTPIKRLIHEFKHFK